MDDELTDDALTGAFRIWQRKKGHRFSVDDVLTAWQACEAARQIEVGSELPVHVDLGCGIGSVLLMVHHRMRWKGLGIEAQEVSIALARKNVERNELGEKLFLIAGDFRETDVSQALRGWRPMLVTGTPPYFPPGTAIPSPDSQRAYARIEYRGGVEDYLRKAAKIVDPEGRIVVCGDARRPERVVQTASDLSLQIVQQMNAFPRAGRASLFSIWSLRPYREPLADTWPVHDWTARDREGARTAQAHALREYFGLAPNLSEHASP